MIRFSLDLEPIAKGRPRFSRQGHAYTPEKTRIFERTVRMLASVYKPVKPLTGALKVTVLFLLRPPKKKVREYPVCKPDLDNLVKGIKDSLNGVMWEDDAQIVDSCQSKRYDWETRMGRIEVTIEELDEPRRAA
jgi:Holliday junction resolvase RusA-like endonuclease